MLLVAMVASAQKFTVYYIDDLRVKDGLIEVGPGVTTSVTFPNEVTMYHLTIPGTVDISPDDEKKTLWFDVTSKKGSTGLIVKTGGVNLRFKVVVTARSTTPVVMVQERSETDREAAPTPVAQNAPPAASFEEVLPGVRLELESRGVEAGVLTLIYKLANKGKTRMVIDPTRARFEGFEARVKTLQNQIIVAPGKSQVGVIEIAKPGSGRLNLMWEILTDISTRTKGTILKVIDVAQYLK
jgi:hypothetical protein